MSEWVDGFKIESVAEQIQHIGKITR